MDEACDAARMTTPDPAWERRNAELWAALDDLEPSGFLARVEALAGELPPGDPVAAFELGSANDSTGHPEQAAPLYREALSDR